MLLNPKCLMNYISKSLLAHVKTPSHYSPSLFSSSCAFLSSIWYFFLSYIYSYFCLKEELSIYLWKARSFFFSFCSCSLLKWCKTLKILGLKNLLLKFQKLWWLNNQLWWLSNVSPFLPSPYLLWASKSVVKPVNLRDVFLLGVRT